MKIAQIGEEILAKPAQQVSAQDLSTQECQGFINAMMQAMLSSGGIGIAAPQVFDPRAIMIIASRPNARYPDAPEMAPMVLVNPAITQTSQETSKDWEGCLSVPGLRGRIERFDWIDVEYLNIEGHKTTQRFHSFVARIFQHEFDHLIGKTWLDRVEGTSDIMAESIWLQKISQ